MAVMINETGIEIGEGLLDFNHVDAFIHPTNNFLWFSGSFERLKEIGGEQLETDATEKGPVGIGEALITDAGRLNAKHLIHVAAWGHDLIPTNSNIRLAIIAGLELADKHYCHSIAMPVAGAEIASFSLATAIEVTFMTLIEFCLKSTVFDRIIILASSHKEKQLLNRLLESASSANPFKSE